jgi:hypothetical protein
MCIAYYAEHSIGESDESRQVIWKKIPRAGCRSGRGTPRGPSRFLGVPRNDKWWAQKQAGELKNKWPRDYGPELGNRRIAANRLIISRRRSSGSGQGCLAGVADLSAGGAVLSAAGGFVFVAGFLASPHPVTATTATNSIAANSCFMFDLLKSGKTVTHDRGDSPKYHVL